MVSTASMIAIIITLFVTLVAPVIVWIIYGVKNKGKGVWKAFVLGAAGFVLDLTAGVLPVGFAGPFFAGALGGGALFLVCPGGTARIRHLGPEPMRSSRWALSSASLTK